MSRWLEGIKSAIEKEFYAPKEKYIVLTLIDNVWQSAGLLMVKSEYDSHEQAAEQAEALLDVERVEQTMVVKKIVICFSDLETKQTIRATEWVGLLV